MSVKHYLNNSSCNINKYYKPEKNLLQNTVSLPEHTPQAKSIFSKAKATEEVINRMKHKKCGTISQNYAMFYRVMCDSEFYKDFINDDKVLCAFVYATYPFFILNKMSPTVFEELIEQAHQGNAIRCGEDAFGFQVDIVQEQITNKDSELSVFYVAAYSCEKICSYLNGGITTRMLNHKSIIEPVVKDILMNAKDYPNYAYFKEYAEKWKRYTQIGQVIKTRTIVSDKPSLASLEREYRLIQELEKKKRPYSK